MPHEYSELPTHSDPVSFSLDTSCTTSIRTYVCTSFSNLFHGIEEERSTCLHFSNMPNSRFRINYASHVSCRESFPYRKYSCIINICKEIFCYLCMWMERYLCKYNLIRIIDLPIFHDFLPVSYLREFDSDNWFVNFNKSWQFQFLENLLWIFAWIIFVILEHLISWRI